MVLYFKDTQRLSFVKKKTKYYSTNSTNLSKFDIGQNGRLMCMQYIRQPIQTNQLEALSQPMIRGTEASADITSIQSLHQLCTLLEQMRKAGRLLAQLLERSIIPLHVWRIQALVQVFVQQRLINQAALRRAAGGLTGTGCVWMHQMNDSKTHVLQI